MNFAAADSARCRPRRYRGQEPTEAEEPEGEPGEAEEPNWNSGKDKEEQKNQKRFFKTLI